MPARPDGVPGQHARGGLSAERRVGAARRPAWRPSLALLQACAIEHSPGMEWLDFITCMYAGYRTVPANGQSCATKAKLNWATLTKCYGGGKGVEGTALIAVRLRAA